MSIAAKSRKPAIVKAVFVPSARKCGTKELMKRLGFLLVGNTAVTVHFELGVHKCKLPIGPRVRTQGW